MLETYFRLTRGRIGRAPEEAGDSRLRDAIIPRGRRRHYIEQARDVAARGTAVGLLAEASWRLTGNQILLTPSGVGLRTIAFGQLLVVTVGGVVGGEMPAAAAWHLALYTHTEAQAALLCQPTATMALLAADVAPDPAAWPAAAQLLGASLVVAGDQRATAAHFAGRQHLLLAGHGLLCWGASLAGAADVADTVERWCEICAHREGESGHSRFKA